MQFLYIFWNKYHIFERNTIELEIGVWWSNLLRKFS